MRHATAFVAPLALIGFFVACSSNSSRATFRGDVNSSDARAPEAGTDPSSGTFVEDANAPLCDRLDCKVADCGEGPTTTLVGKVYDPAGANPLYNVQVYIPKLEPGEELPPLADTTVDGVACETCASVVVNPLRSAITNEKGEFTLENVPVDKNVPVVIQVGKWRRKFEIEVKNACDENKVSDRTLKLPRNGSEGDMPQIAVSTGGCDALECLLRGIGVDDNEFVQGHGGSGHVHVFKGELGEMGAPAQSFWNDAEQLKKYDMVLLSCECGENLPNKGGSAQGARGSMYDYLNAGGRVFATHFHYSWFRYSPSYDFRQIASWGSSDSSSGDYNVNMDFPNGDMLARWLVETGGSSTLGKVPLTDATGSITRVNSPATTWISRPSAPKFLSFNTPVDVPEDEQCGRAVFSDVHVTGNGGPSSISGCSISAGGLSGQQKALEFLFFDLSSCVQKIEDPPTPPTK